jgi:hypothetical protein
MIDKYGWRPASQTEVDELAKQLDLMCIFHSVADTSLWYRREDAEACRSYFDIKPYARRRELDYYETPEAGFEINQKNVNAYLK